MENNDKPLNGICIDGRFYESVQPQTEISDECSGCALYQICDNRLRGYWYCERFPQFEGNIFRFSQSITDKINGK